MGVNTLHRSGSEPGWNSVLRFQREGRNGLAKDATAVLFFTWSFSQQRSGWRASRAIRLSAFDEIVILLNRRDLRVSFATFALKSPRCR
jgi:hypothetical protein